MSAASPRQVIQHLVQRGPDLPEISLLCNQVIVAESKGDMMLCVRVSVRLHISLPGCLFFFSSLKDIGSLYLTLVTFIPITHP